MRRLVLMFIVGLAALVLVPHAAEAKGVKLTKQQVETVCDGKQSCVRDCGLKNDHLCSFTCRTTNVPASARVVRVSRVARSPTTTRSMWLDRQ